MNVIQRFHFNDKYAIYTCHSDRFVYPTIKLAGAIKVDLKYLTIVTRNGKTSVVYIEIL